MTFSTLETGGGISHMAKKTAPPTMNTNKRMAMSLGRFLIRYRGIGPDLTTLGKEYVRFRLWRYLGSVPARRGPFNDPATGATRPVRWSAVDCATDERPGKLESGKSIVLVGLMGAGKSSVGTRLAKRLGLPFQDADAEIVKAAGCSIEDIFTVYGEFAFRDGERRGHRAPVGGRNPRFWRQVAAPSST